MRDLLPDFVHGQLDAARSVEVREHVASCAECAAELELLNEVVAGMVSAPTMSVERIVAALPTSTRQGLLLHRGGAKESELEVRSIGVSTSTSRRFWSRPSVRLAAGLAIVTAGGLSLLVGRDVLRPEVQVGQTGKAPPSSEIAMAPIQTAPVSPAPSITPAHATTSTQQTVVASTGELSLAGEVEELSDEHLATLLDEIDKMDGLPGEEPESMEQGIGGADSAGLDR
jgi:hypothetical protein